MPASRKLGGAASGATRYQGVSTQQTVFTRAGVLQRLIVANADAAVQTVTVADDTSTRIVVRVPAGQTVSLEFGMGIATSLKLTPSSANLDVLALYD